jgi:lysozyme
VERVRASTPRWRAGDAMKTSAAGIELIKAHEGLRLVAYPDPGSGGDPWTIGYGTTHGVHPGMKITPEQAHLMLVNELPVFENVVNHGVHVEITQHEFDALVSFVYNVGSRNFLGSSVLRKLNAGDKHGAAESFLLWNKASHHVMAGLTKRRHDERNLFLTA